jgi:dUTP pyrophosphatase
MNVTVPFTLEPGATAPEYQTRGSAGMDLRINEDVELGPGEYAMVGTGIRMAIPDGYEGQVRPRSGLAAKHGISMVNAPGTIDSDYRGEIRLLLINLGREVVSLRRGDRAAQMVITPVVQARLEPADELPATDRGEGGFGSTGT